MPLYEYQCESCGRRTEALQRMSDPPLAVCPHCGGALKKLLSAPAFQLKGSGWYATDYAKKTSGDSAKKKESSASEEKSSKLAENAAPATEKSAPAGGTKPPATSKAE